MTRSSKHILKYQTDFKTILLDQLFDDYTKCLIYYLDLIVKGTLPLKVFLSSKQLPDNYIYHGQWKQVVYKHVSSVLRSLLRKSENKRFQRYKKVYAKAKESGKFVKFTNKRFNELNLKPIFFTKYFPKINFKNISIDIDSRLVDFQSTNKEFDEFVNLRLPYRDPQGKHRKSLSIKLPVKYHKHSLKFKNWKRANTIRIQKINNNYYLSFFYKKEESTKKSIGSIVGIDQGFKNLITCSNGRTIGKEINFLYEKITRKKQGSKAFKRSLIERDNYINHCINSDLDFENYKEIIIENLKNVKHKSKFSKKINNKLQRWVYPKVVRKLEFICQENGVLLTKVNPAYTSQRCSSCGFVSKENRNNSMFKCLQCEMLTDADYNAAINISYMGVYNPHNPENQDVINSGCS